MPADVNAYHFVTRWRVAGTCGEVADILGDPERLSLWWPSVYLRVEQIAAPDSRGVGRRLRLLTKGWLPYTLTWESVVVESRYPYGFTIDAVGDFVGQGIWTFAQEGSFVDVTYDWDIRAEKPLLKALAPVLKPLFEANHRWAMRQGEDSLKLELLRRRATNDATRMAVPPPPGAVTFAGIALVGGAALIGGTLACLMIRARRRARPRSRHGREPRARAHRFGRGV
jgi:hypothetical protein